MMRIAVIVALVAGAFVAFGGYWWVDKHQRISQGTLQSDVAEHELASNVTCIERAANGEVWLCAGTVSDQPHCWIVHVRVMGDVKYRDGRNRCKQQPALAGLFAPPSTT